MLILPGFFESYRSLKDRTLKLTIGTQELTPQQMADIQSALMKTGYLAFSTEQFSSSQEKYLTELEVDYDDKAKTPSKRLRSVLYIAFEQDKKGYKTFNDFYNSQMELLINHFKSKLE